MFRLGLISKSWNFLAAPEKPQIAGLEMKRKFPYSNSIHAQGVREKFLQFNKLFSGEIK
jgi:hypothetical protein